MRSSFFILFLIISLPAHAQKAPDFTFTDTNGKTWNLYDELAKGKTVLIDFFFADCTPCKTYTPMVEQLYKDYGSGGGDVMVIGISDRDDDQKMKEFEQAYGVTYPSAGVEGGGDSITGLYMNWFPFTAWPTYAVICPDTTINWNVPKSEGLPEIRAAIDACADVSTINRKPEAFKDINIYPVPASEYIMIDNLPAGEAFISIIDLTGIEVLSKHNSNSPSMRIDLPSLSPGAYCLRIHTPDGQLYKLITIQE